MSKFSIEPDQKKEPRPKSKDMEKTLHITYHLTGPDVDKIDFHDVLVGLQEDWDFAVTSGQSNVYYTQERKPEVTLKKAEHPNKDGQDSFSVRAGK